MSLIVDKYRGLIHINNRTYVRTDQISNDRSSRESRLDGSLRIVLFVDDDQRGKSARNTVIHQVYKARGPQEHGPADRTRYRIAPLQGAWLARLSKCRVLGDAVQSVFFIVIVVVYIVIIDDYDGSSRNCPVAGKYCKERKNEREEKISNGCVTRANNILIRAEKRKE